MTTYHLSEAMNEIRDDLILDALPPSWVAKSAARPSRPRHSLGRFWENGWGVAAACAVVSAAVLFAVVAAGRITPPVGPAPGPAGSLPAQNESGDSRPDTPAPDATDTSPTLPDGEIDPGYTYPGETSVPDETVTMPPFGSLDPDYTLPDALKDPKPELPELTEAAGAIIRPLSVTTPDGQEKILSLRLVKLRAHPACSSLRPESFYMDIVDSERGVILDSFTLTGNVMVYSSAPNRFHIVQFTAEIGELNYPMVEVVKWNVLAAYVGGDMTLQKHDAVRSTFYRVEPTYLTGSEPYLRWEQIKETLAKRFDTLDPDTPILMNTVGEVYPSLALLQLRTTGEMAAYIRSLHVKDLMELFFVDSEYTYPDYETQT